jgi:precorrin-6Y C5,15-methyltransferase (decarboxylating)
MSIQIVGMGMGSPETLTAAAKKALDTADVIIGAERLLRSLPSSLPAQKHEAISTDEITVLIDDNPSKSICILMSGDTGFYSGTAKLAQALEGRDVKIIPGISCVQYFASKLKRPWQDWKLMSAHGKVIDAAREVRDNKETFFLTGGEMDVKTICRLLMTAGFGGLLVTVGENLGGDKERITSDTAGTLALLEFEPLAVMLVDNPNPARLVSCGFTDDSFIRGGIPMTKSEVRSVILSKLRLCDSDIVYDIGAGTGSVSVEAALLARNGSVYAFERASEGCRLIRENAEKFGAANITVILGEAPASFSGLPAPDAAFVGGSGGNLRDILENLLRMNPNIRLVVSAVTLETLSGVTALFAEIPVCHAEIVQLSVSRAKLMGASHLMTAQNPVFIISGEGNNG